MSEIKEKIKKMDYWIPLQNKQAVSKKMEKLSKKSLKLGFNMSFSFTGETRIEPSVSQNGSHMTAIEFEKLVVVGQEPVIEGWQFVAILQHEQSGNVVRRSALVGVKLPDAYLTTEPQCDHCGLTRHRKDTYILQNVSSGELKQVGSGCLVDFIGHGDPHSVASYFEFLLELENLDEFPEGRGFSDGGLMIDTTGYLKIVCATINKYGWVSRSKADGQIPTADLAVEVALQPDRYNVDFDGCQDESEAAIKWCLSAWENAASEYQHNVHVIISKSWLSIRDFGLAASLIPAYRKAKSEVENGAGFVGEIGGKISLTITPIATLVSANRFSGRRVTTYINKFLTPEGNIIVWFSADWDGSKHTGEKFEAVATVKDHKTFGREKQTTIIRVKGIE